MAEETGWLIERYWNGMLVYWTGKWAKTSYGPDIKTGWSKDANKALRFARKIDADDYAKAGRFVAGLRATEHKWVGQ